MGGTQQLARLAGGLAGLGLAFAAAAPFSGVPPQGVSGKPVAAQIEVRALASGELDIDPVGIVLEPAAFPAPGAKGGPAVSLKIRNITGVPVRVTLRLSGISPTLDDAVTVRGSGAGAVLIDGPLRTASAWTIASGLLSSGETTTLRLRFKLRAGLPPEAYSGRVDVRQLQLKGVPLSSPSTTVPPTTPGATTPGGTTPVATTPAPTTPAATTPSPAPAAPSASGDDG